VEQEWEGLHEGRGSDQGLTPSCFCRKPHGPLNSEGNAWSSHAASIQSKDASACSLELPNAA
jgi:hypothetical protein